MKSYLAVFLGKPEAMDAWRAMPEAERNQKQQAGIEAWHKWVSDNKESIAEGLTTRQDKAHRQERYF